MGYFDDYYGDDYSSGYFDGYYSEGKAFKGKTFKRKIPVDEQISELETSLSNEGVDVPPSSKRGVLERIFDGLSVGLYPTMGFLTARDDTKQIEMTPEERAGWGQYAPNPTGGKMYKIVENTDTDPIQGIVEGFKAANPFGEGNPEGRKTMSDWMEAKGWKEEYNPDGVWNDPSTWNNKNVNRNIVSLLGDIAFDPTTYMTFGIGGLIRGAGRSAAKGTAKALAKEGFEAGMKELAEGGAKRLLREAGQETTDDVVKGLINKVDDTAKMSEKAKSGFGILLPGLNIPLISGKTMAKIGDKTLAPLTRPLLDKLGDKAYKATNLFRSEAKQTALKSARENPMEFANLVARNMKAQDLLKGFKSNQIKLANDINTLFEKTTKEERIAMTDLMEDSKNFKFDVKDIYTGNDITKMTEQAQNTMDKYTSMRNGIQDTINKYKELGVNQDKITIYENILSKIDNVLDSTSNKYSDLLASSGLDKQGIGFNELNDLKNTNAEDIVSKYRKLGVQNPEELGYTIRATVDKGTEYMTPQERKYFTGKEMTHQLNDMNSTFGKPYTPDDMYDNYITKKQYDEMSDETKDLYDNWFEPDDKDRYSGHLWQLAGEIKESPINKLYREIYNKEIALKNESLKTGKRIDIDNEIEKLTDSNNISPVDYISWKRNNGFAPKSSNQIDNNIDDILLANKQRKEAYELEKLSRPKQETPKQILSERESKIEEISKYIANNSGNAGVNQFSKDKKIALNFKKYIENNKNRKGIGYYESLAIAKNDLSKLSDEDLQIAYEQMKGEKESLAQKTNTYFNEVDSGAAKGMADAIETERYNKTQDKPYAGILDEDGGYKGYEQKYFDKNPMQKQTLSPLAELADKIVKSNPQKGYDSGEVFKRLLELDDETLIKQGKAYGIDLSDYIEQPIAKNMSEQVTKQIKELPPLNSFTYEKLPNGKYIVKRNGEIDNTFGEFDSMYKAQTEVKNWYNDVKNNKMQPYTSADEGIDQDFIDQYFNKKAEFPYEVQQYNKLKKELNNPNIKPERKANIEAELDDLEIKVNEWKKEQRIKKEEAFDNMFSTSKSEADMFNVNGTQITQPSGSPQMVKPDMIINAMKKLGKFDPKFNNYLSKFAVHLTEIDGWAEAATDMEKIIFGTPYSKLVNPELDLVKNIKQKVFPHEFAHNFGNRMYDQVFGETNIWKQIAEEEGELFKGVKYNSKLAQEDFAESFVKYVNDPVGFKQEYPKRFEAINQAVKDFTVPNTNYIDKNKASQYFQMPESAKQSAEKVIQQSKDEELKIIDNIINSGYTSEGDALKALEDVDNVINNTDEFAARFREETGLNDVFETVPETIQTTTIKAKDNLNVDKENVRIMEAVKNMFYKWGITEQEMIDNGIDINKTILDYVPHTKSDVQNELTPEQIQNLKDSGYKFKPFENVHAKRRTLDGTIQQINAMIEKKTGKKHFFEDDLSKLTLERGLRHNQAVYDKQYWDNYVSAFGTRVDNINNIPVDKKLYVARQDIGKALENVNIKNADETLKSLGIPKKFLNSFEPIVEVNADTFVRLKNQHSGLQAFTMPDVVVANINKAGNILTDESTLGILNLYDKLTTLMKINMTAVKTGFHGRNIQGNEFNNFLNVGVTGLNPKVKYQAAKLLGKDENYLNKTMIKTKDGKQYSLMQVRNMMEKLDVVRPSQFDVESSSVAGKQANAGNTTDVMVKNKGKGFKFDANMLNPLSPVIDIKHPLHSLFQSAEEMGVTQKQQFLLHQGGRAIGSAVENHARAVNFLANVINDNDFFKSADNTNKFLFDYNDLSDFERKVMKRIIPFYTWMRKNIPLQLEMLVEKPNIYRTYSKGMNTIEGSVEDDERVPDKYKNDFAKDWIQLPGMQKGKSSVEWNPATKQYDYVEPKDEPAFINPNLPLGDLGKVPLPTADFAKQMFSSMNQMIKAPIELQANKNMYFDTPISRGVGDTKDAPGYLQSLLGGTAERPAQMDAKDRYLLQAFSGALEDVSKAMDVKNSSDETKLTLIKSLLGPSLYSYDVETFKKWSQRDRLKLLKDLAKRNNYMIDEED